MSSILKQTSTRAVNVLFRPSMLWRTVSRDANVRCSAYRTLWKNITPTFSKTQRRERSGTDSSSASRRVRLLIWREGLIRRLRDLCELLLAVGVKCVPSDWGSQPYVSVREDHKRSKASIDTTRFLLKHGEYIDAPTTPIMDSPFWRYSLERIKWLWETAPEYFEDEKNLGRVRSLCLAQLFLLYCVQNLDSKDHLMSYADSADSGCGAFFKSESFPQSVFNICDKEVQAFERGAVVLAV